MPEGRVDALRLGGYGVVARDVDDAGVGDPQLMPAHGTFVGDDRPGDLQRGFLRKPFELAEQRFILLALFDHALAQAGAVPKDDERDLAAGPDFVDPALQRDGVPDAVAKTIDCCDGFHEHYY